MILIEVTVFCESCMKFEKLGYDMSLTRANAIAKSKGWKSIQRDKHVCPKCIEKQNEVTP